MLDIPKALSLIIIEAVAIKLGIDLQEPEISLVEVLDLGENKYTFSYKTVPLGLLVQMDTEDKKVISATIND